MHAALSLGCPTGDVTLALPVDADFLQGQCVAPESGLHLHSVHRWSPTHLTPHPEHGTSHLTNLDTNNYRKGDGCPVH